MPRRLLDRILAAQAPDGAFPSRVHLGDRVLDDRNVFVTGLVLRSLPGRDGPSPLGRARDRALDFLEASESRHIRGSFGFWPADGRPDWAPSLPEDADDTAIVALELFRHGRRDLQWLRRVACDVLLSHRLGRVDPWGPPWIVRGAFLTWLRRGGANGIDCCVNANVAALFAVAGLGHLSAVEACASMIDRAVTWAAGSPERLRSLAPFYAHPCELMFSVTHAVSCGIGRLEPVRRALAARGPGVDGTDVLNRPVCSSAYGHTVWSAPVLQLARSLSGNTG
jgi:hypothetical protein